MKFFWVAQRGSKTNSCALRHHECGERQFFLLLIILSYYHGQKYDRLWAMRLNLNARRHIRRIVRLIIVRTCCQTRRHAYIRMRCGNFETWGTRWCDFLFRKRITGRLGRDIGLQLPIFSVSGKLRILLCVFFGEFRKVHARLPQWLSSTRRPTQW